MFTEGLEMIFDWKDRRKNSSIENVEWCSAQIYSFNALHRRAEHTFGAENIVPKFNDAEVSPPYAALIKNICHF